MSRVEDFRRAILSESESLQQCADFTRGAPRLELTDPNEALARVFEEISSKLRKIAWTGIP